MSFGLWKMPMCVLGCREYRLGRTRVPRMVVALVCVLVCHAVTVIAQQPDRASADSALIAQAMAHVNVPVDSAAVAAAAAKADTGRMQPGYRDLTRYNTPGYCVAAIYGMEHITWRHGQRNLRVPESAEDTLPTAARVVGQRCAARLDREHLAPLELPNVMRLAVLTGDTTLLRTAISQQLALATTAGTRGDVWLDAIKELTGHAELSLVRHPADAARATDFLRQLDALGKGAIVQRLQAHSLFFDLYQGEWFDTTALYRESHAIATIASALSDSARHVYPYVSSLSALWMDSIVTAYYRQDPRLVSIVKHQLQLGAKGFPAEEIRKGQGVLDFFVYRAEQVGTMAQIPGDFWFPENRAQKVPVAGRVTLIMSLSRGDGIMDRRGAMMRRLSKKYGAQGLDIVGVVRTEGYSWSSPPQTPDAEAKVDAWYFLDYLKLPITLVVEQTPFTTQPDGRRVVAGPDRLSARYPMTPAMLVGRDGRIITTSVGLNTDAEFEAYIEKALR